MTSRWLSSKGKRNAFDLNPDYTMHLSTPYEVYQRHFDAEKHLSCIQLLARGKGIWNIYNKAFGPTDPE